MATITTLGASGLPSAANLSNAQVGNGASTNLADRGSVADPRSTPAAGLVRVTTTIGATPTCTYALECSPDGVTWLPVAYADSATPTTVSVATFVITTATTVWKVLRGEIPWRFFRITYSANTNVTNTADLWVF
jgi:hypothetical protein